MSINFVHRRRSRQPFHLEIEQLEARDVPSTSPFLLDSSNRLFAATDATGQTYVNTGAFGIQLSVGEIGPSGGGGQFAVIRDGNNRVYLFNGNNNTFTTTNAFATDIVAGRGEVFLRDGDNRVYVVTLGALNPDGTFSVTVTATAGFAIQMDVGFDTSTVRDFLAYRAGDNSVHYIETVAGGFGYGSSGAFAIDLVAGNQKETFIRDGANRVYVLTINTASIAGITSLPAIQTNVFALQMSVGRASPSGNDMMAYRGLNNSVNFISYTPGAPPTLAFVSIPDAFAVQVSAGSNEIFTRDMTNRVIYYVIDSGGTTTTQKVTNAFAIDLRVTTFSSIALPIDQIAILDGNRRLYVSVNNAGGDEIASFFDTALFARDVQGFARFP